MGDVIGGGELEGCGEQRGEGGEFPETVVEECAARAHAGEREPGGADEERRMEEVGCCECDDGVCDEGIIRHG